MKICPRYNTLWKKFVRTELEEHSIIAMEWFENNYMKINSDQCHLFISGNKSEHFWTKIGNNRPWKSRIVKLLGIIIDNKLKFNEHLSNVCLKVNSKLPVWTRTRKYLDFKITRILFKGFFEAQFKYCPLTWMFYSTSLNRKIYLHERALRLTYDDYELTFEKLVVKDGSFTIHHYDIQMLCIELYKVYHNLSQTILNELSILII